MSAWAYTNIADNANLDSMANGQVLVMIGGRIGATNITTVYSQFDRFSEGQIIHFSLDEGTGTSVFDSISAIQADFYVTGTRPIADIEWVDGLISNAVNFNGTPTVADRAMLRTAAGADGNFQSAITISVWFKQSVAGDSVGMLLSKWISGTTNGSYLLRRGVDGLRFHVVDENSVRTQHVVLGCIPDPTAWNHAVATWDSADGVMEIWVNGVSFGTKAATTALIKSLPAARLTIGDTELDPTAHNGFQGTIDEVRLWNRRLSDTEIVSLYQVSGGPGSGGMSIAEGLGSPEGVVTGMQSNQVYLELNAGDEVVSTWYFRGTLGTNTGWK